jgi:hypothetical protein
LFLLGFIPSGTIGGTILSFAAPLAANLFCAAFRV